MDAHNQSSEIAVHDLARVDAQRAGSYAGAIRENENAINNRLVLFQTINYEQLMALQTNKTINRRCDEMQRLLQEMQEMTESLRMNPDNEVEFETRIRELERELKRLREEA